MNITSIMVATVITSILVLAGCGGGGPPASPNPPTGESQGTAQSTPSPNTILNDLTAEDVQGSAEDAATARAKFGSVTQSSNVAGGVTTDTASASFDGSQLTFSVTREDGSVENFRPPSEATRQFDVPDPGSESEGRRGWVLISSSGGNAASIAFAAASWDQQAAQTQWLAQGIWIRVGDLENPTPQNVEIGTFVDGPEIEQDAELGGISGTATYDAFVSGLYVSEGGSGDEPKVGIFNSELRLEANFGSNTVSGCVGCGTGIEIQEISTDNDEPETAPFQIRLGAATINDNGRVESGSTSVESTEAQVTSTSGSWSGRFSSVNENGRPRGVAGTLGNSFTFPKSADTTETEDVVFVGSFLGTPAN